MSHAVVKRNSVTNWLSLYLSLVSAGSAALKMKDWDKAGEEIEALGEGLSGSEGEEVGEW